MPSDRLDAKFFDPEVDFDLKGRRCPYCHSPFVEGDVLVRCGKCDRGHHLECWRDHGNKCAVFECTGLGLVRDPSPAAREHLQQAIQSGSDLAIARSWKRGKGQLTKERRAAYAERVQLAERRCEALKRLDAAIAANDDRKIVRDYDAGLLDACTDVTAEQRARVAFAIRRVRALDEINAALQTRVLTDVVAAYSQDLLTGCTELDEVLHSTLQRTCEAAARLEQALGGDSDLEILDVLRKVQAILGEFILEQAWVDRVQLARQRTAALQRFQKALSTGNAEQIVAAYEPALLDDCRDVSIAEREKLEAALARAAILQQLSDALSADDSPRIYRIYEENRDWIDSSTLVAAHRSKIARARREALHEELRRAIRSGKVSEILAKGKRALEEGAVLTTEEQEELRVAAVKDHAMAEMKAAIRTDDDRQINLVFESWLPAYLDELPAEDHQRVSLATQRVRISGLLQRALEQRDGHMVLGLLGSHPASLFENSHLFDSMAFDHSRWQDWGLAVDRLRDALKSENQSAMMRAYEDCVSKEPFSDSRGVLTSSMLTSWQRRCLHDVREVVAFWNVKGAAAVSKLVEEALDARVRLSNRDLDRIGRAQILANVRTALDSGDDELLVMLLAAHGLPGDRDLSEAEQQRVLLAQRRFGALTRLRKALASDNDRRIRHAYDPRLLGSTTALTPDELQRIERALKLTPHAETRIA